MTDQTRTAAVPQPYSNDAPDRQNPASDRHTSRPDEREQRDQAADISAVIARRVRQRRYTL